ncbi:MAG: LytR/AlgR family response regulator transcription factor [Verrucomicrobiota bacterium]
MKVLILDDEPPARRNLRNALSDIGVDEVREAGSIEQAVRALKEERPDVMFLDVELRGGKKGFDLLDALDAEGIPAVFVTAHAEHAVRAFEARAIDYLLKPVDPHRLKESLKRIGESSDAEDVRIFLKHETAMFRDGTRNVLLKVGDIYLLEAGDSYTKLVLADKSGPMVNGTLKSVLGRIDPEVFFQANRTQAINLEYVTQVEDGESGLIAVLANGIRVELSRRQSSEFRRLKAI